MKLKLLAKIIAASLFATSVFASVKPAKAATINGVLNITGQAGFMSDSFSEKFNVSSNSTGIFAGITDEGSIKSFTTPPSGTPITVTNFLSVPTSGGNVFFDLVNFSQSNISIQNLSNGSTTLNVPVNGVWYDIDGNNVPGVGVFTAQFAPGQSREATTYSASISTLAAVPEPSGTAGVLTLGAVGGMFVLRNCKQFFKPVKF